MGLTKILKEFISMVIINALHNKAIPICWAGLKIRSWIYVLDHRIAVDLIVRNGKAGKVYNISGKEVITNLDLSKEILRTLGKKEY